MSKEKREEDERINPHMPQYIVKPPWYFNPDSNDDNNTQSTTNNKLNHQRSQNEPTRLPITTHTQKGITSDRQVYKFRKGACENCGSMTHKLKECCERPRKRGARFTGKDFKPDEYIYEVPLDYEGKRDRWNGYDPDSYKKLVYEFKRYEEEKKRIKLEQIGEIEDERERKKILRDEDLNESLSSEDENKLLNPEVDAQFTEEEVNEYIEALKKDPKNKHFDFDKYSKEELYKFATSKSLNIGDDYSKYLLSLSLESAYYCPKSRSMRENPLAGQSSDKTSFKGDNYNLKSGDTQRLLDVEGFINQANTINKDLGVSILY
jgi:pre-mRNA-processing factor SLU7